MLTSLFLETLTLQKREARSMEDDERKYSCFQRCGENPACVIPGITAGSCSGKNIWTENDGKTSSENICRDRRTHLTSGLRSARFKLLPDFQQNYRSPWLLIPWPIENSCKILARFLCFYPPNTVLNIKTSSLNKKSSSLRWNCGWFCGEFGVSGDETSTKKKPMLSSCWWCEIAVLWKQLLENFLCEDDWVGETGVHKLF